MQNLTRRGFIKTSTTAALGMGIFPESLTVIKDGRIAGANDRIGIGVIGCGDRGIRGLMEGVNRHSRKMNTEIIAVSDPWRIARGEANARVMEWHGRKAAEYVSYRDLLTDKNVDAVLIASPDHVHTLHLEAAAKARKHIYIEKPLAMEMDKLVKAFDAVKEAGTVVQVGTQIRSLPGIAGSRELVMQGALGKLSRVEECRNSSQPYWYRYLKDVSREDVDWQEFLHDRPMRPFSATTYSGWYGYLEFSQGPISGLGSHFIDLVHYITGAAFPESCVCLGGIFTWKDKYQFTAPDCIQATWIYPEGFLVSSSNNMGHGAGSVRNFYGDQGMINAGNWSAPRFTVAGSPHGNGSSGEEHPVRHIDRPDHFLDWLQCMRSGETTHAPIEAGYQHAVAVLMAAISYETGRKTVYDRQNRVIRTV